MDEHRRRLLALLGTAGVTTLAGCGSDDDDGGTDGTNDPGTATEIPGDGTDDTLRQTATNSGESGQTDSTGAAQTATKTRTIITPGSSDWTSFCFDARNTGHHPSGDPPSGSLSENWRLETEDTALSAVVLNETVYVGTGGLDGHLYALDTATGTERWRQHLDTDIPAPAFADSTLIIGADDIYGLDAATGRLLWTDGTGPYAPLTASDGTVYIGGFSLQAHRAKTGDRVWVSRNDIHAKAAPAVANDTVYIGNDDNEMPGEVVALSMTDGSTTWTFEASRGGFASPAVANGRVYISNAYPRPDAEPWYYGKLFALDAVTGEKHWEFGMAGGAAYSPAVANGTVYIGSANYPGRLFALEADTGEEKWNVEVESPWTCSPVIADGMLFIGNRDGHLYTISTAEGEISGSFQVGGDYVPTPVVNNGQVFVGSKNAFYALM
jgi:outer membrane protein assembly factor BamB